MAHRIEIQYHPQITDTRAQARTHKLNRDFSKVQRVKVVDVYTINKDFDEFTLQRIADALSNPVLQSFCINEAQKNTDFSYAVEVGFLPGVTDNTGHTAKEIIEDLLKVKFSPDEDVYFSQVNIIEGEISPQEIDEISRVLANNLIQRTHIKSYEQFTNDAGMYTIVPKVSLNQTITIDEVNLNVDDDELIKIGKEGVANDDGTRRGPLALDLKSMHAIRDYFKKIGRNPTDIELESLAQTWSEHCKHTIFASQIDDIEGGLYKHYIKRATQDIRKQKGENDFCVSVFKDNSGGIIFDENWVITDKVETHNSPSALDPFGGAVTGIVGVNRDTIGFGKGALPVINKYGYCFANPFDDEPLYKDKDLTVKMLSPRRILEGVVDGVNAGGNCSGIPTPQGFVYFNDRYKGKPLVFVGTIGLIPREINGKEGWEKQAQVGDKIVMVGGKVGADGIHGATFSSESLDSGSPATAVQIGDPYTQKKLSDAIVKEARDLDLYNSITDNGAGGISSSIGEMAKESGGCVVYLDKVPLKYPGLQPWQIWISESQERMTLAIPPQKVDEFMSLMNRRGVEAWVIGEFTNSGNCVIKYGEKTILDMELEFMHDGAPNYHLKTNWQTPVVSEPQLPNFNQQEAFLQMLSSLNNTSFSFISYQYDYEVLAGSCVKPLQGKGQVNGVASVTRPVLESKKGVVCSQALYPLYTELDSYRMAGASIDTAIRNCLSVGGSLNHLALLDNFCWCSPNKEDRLGQLKDAAQGCYDFAVAYGTPYISGKDSMYNDFKGYDKNGNLVEISVPPTLLISATGVVQDTDKCITIDAKNVGDLVYVLGETKNEMGGSEFLSNYLKIAGGTVPEVDAEANKKLYEAFEKAVEQKVIASASSVGIGGLAMSLAKTSIAGLLGMKIDLSSVQTPQQLANWQALYSESQGRFVVTINPKNLEEFEAIFTGQNIFRIGEITADRFEISGLDSQIIVDTTVQEMAKNYQQTFKDF